MVHTRSFSLRTIGQASMSGVHNCQPNSALMEIRLQICKVFCQNWISALHKVQACKQSIFYNFATSAILSRIGMYVWYSMLSEFSKTSNANTNMLNMQMSCSVPVLQFRSHSKTRLIPLSPDSFQAEVELQCEHLTILTSVVGHDMNAWCLSSTMRGRVPSQLSTWLFSTFKIARAICIYIVVKSRPNNFLPFPVHYDSSRSLYRCISVSEHVFR